MFSRDVTVAMLVSLNKETAVMLVSPTNPPGVEVYSYANAFFVLVEKMLIDHVRENTLDNDLVAWQSIGRISNNDGNGNENVTCNRSL